MNADFENLYNTVESWLDGQMSEEDSATFEQRMATDDEIKLLVEEIKTAREIISELDLLELDDLQTVKVVSAFILGPVSGITSSNDTPNIEDTLNQSGTDQTKDNSGKIRPNQKQATIQDTMEGTKDDFDKWWDLCGCRTINHIFDLHYLSKYKYDGKPLPFGNSLHQYLLQYDWGLNGAHRYDLIESWLAGKAILPLSIGIKAKMALEPEFAALVEHHRQARTVIDQWLKDDFKKQSRELRQADAVQKRRRLWLLLAGLVAVVGLAIWLLYPQQPEQPVIEPAQNQIPVVGDSTGVQPQAPVEKNNLPKSEIAPPIVKKESPSYKKNKQVVSGFTSLSDLDTKYTQQKIDASENEIAGATVHLYYDANENGEIDDSELSNIVATTITDTNGNYYFSNLKEGMYIARTASPIDPLVGLSDLTIYKVDEHANGLRLTVTGKMFKLEGNSNTIETFKNDSLARAIASEQLDEYLASVEEREFDDTRSAGTESHFQAGCKAFDERNWSKARQELTQVTPFEESDYTQALELLALMAFREKNFRQAADYYETFAPRKIGPSTDWRLAMYYLADYPNSKGDFWRVMNKIRQSPMHRYYEKTGSLKETLENRGIRQ